MRHVTGPNWQCFNVHWSHGARPRVTRSTTVINKLLAKVAYAPPTNIWVCSTNCLFVSCDLNPGLDTVTWLLVQMQTGKSGLTTHHATERLNSQRTVIAVSRYFTAGFIILSIPKNSTQLFKVYVHNLGLSILLHSTFKYWKKRKIIQLPHITPAENHQESR